MAFKDYSNIVSGARNSKKDENKNSSNSTSRVKDYSSLVDKHIYNKSVNFDTLESDLTSLTKTITSIYSGWQTPETMRNTRLSVQSMYDRLGKYKEYQKRYGGTDLSELHTTLKSILDDWDNISKDYGKYKSGDDYKKAADAAIKQAEEYEGMKTADIKSLNTEVTSLEDIYKIAKGYNDKVKSVSNSSINIRGANDYYNYEKNLKKVTAERDAYLKSIGYESFEDLEKELSKKKQYKNKAEWIQKGINLSSVGDESSENYDANFAEKSKYIAPKERTGFRLEIGVQDEDVYKFINDEKFRSDYATFSNGNADASLWSVGYEYMTDKEKQTYNYYYNSGDIKKANEYLNTISEELGNRKANADFDRLKGNSLDEYSFGIVSGLDQFASGMKNLFNTSDEYIPVSSTQQLSGLVREDVAYKHGKLGQIGYDLINTTSNMLPSILTSTVIGSINPVVGSAVGSAMMGASASGNAYQEMLNLGYDKGQSRVYSALVGVSEAGLQYALGGIGKLGGVSGKLSKVVSGIDNGIARFAIRYGGSMLSEGFEEAAQEVLTPLFKNLAAGYETGEDVDWSEVVYSGLLGALSGGFLEGAPLAVNSISEHSYNKSMGQTIKANERVPEVFDIASNPEVASAYEAYTQYANKGINAENISDAKLGKLYSNAMLDAQDVLDSKNSTAEQREAAEKTIADLETYGQYNPERKVSKKAIKETYNDAGTVDALIAEGLESGKDTTSYKLASEYKDKIESGKKLSTDEISNLVKANDDAFKAETSESVATSLEKLGETSDDMANIVTRKVNGEKITLAEAEKLNASENALKVLAENVNEDLVGYVKTMDDGAAANLFISLYDGKTDVDAYANAFNLATAYAKNDFTFDTILKNKGVLSTDQVKTIYAETRIKADKDAEAKIQNLIKETAKQNDYKGSIDDSVINYENTSVTGKVNWNKLDSRQKQAVTLMKGLAITSGMNLVIEHNAKSRYNGSYQISDNTITMDIAKYIGKNSSLETEAIIPAFSHEITHWAKRKAPDTWRSINEVVFPTLVDYYNSNTAQAIKDKIEILDRLDPSTKHTEEDAKGRAITEEDLIRAEMNRRGKSEDVSREEIIARACEDMLKMGEQGKKMFNSLPESERKTLVGRIKELIQNLKDWVSYLLNSYSSTSKEAQIMQMYQEKLNVLSKLWDKMLVESVEANQALEKSNTYGHITSIGNHNLNELSDAVTTDGEQLFQYRAMVEDEEIYRAMLLKNQDIVGISEEQINDLFDTIDKAVDIISENLEALDYAWDADINERAFSPIKPNSDSLYQVSLDFSTLCRKRLLQQTIQNTLQEALNKNLSKEESIAIRDELIKVQEEGRKIEVACALCYVEAARMKSPVQITKFLNNREAIIKEFFANRSGGSINEKVKAAEMRARKTLKKNNPDGFFGKNGVELDALTAPKSKMLKADADFVRAEGKKARASYQLTEHEQAELDAALKMSVGDFTSAKGLENLAKNHRDLFDAYTSFVRNATHSKGIENDTWWRAGDSESIGDNLIAQMNKENGLRSQSWSDFQVIHLLDYVAATIELSTKGAKRQSYTKVPDYVKLLGNTGDMINMSLIPERVFNGKLAYDGVEGMAYDIAKQLRDEYHATVGTICIGINNEQIRMLLEDGTIDMVIPYHHSSMSAATRRLMHIPDWESYQNYQGEKNLSDEEAKASAKEYGVELKKDNNYQKAPKFSEWFNLEEARQIAKLENANPSDAKAYKKYGKMYGGYMAMQNAANNYLKLCAERGIAPKFSHEKADFTHDANYWKLLIDRKMVDNVTGEIIEQKAIKPVFNEQHVLEILNDELARYPQVKADQEYAQRKVTEKFLSGEMKVDKSTLEAIQKPVDNISNVNILESSKDNDVLNSEKYSDDFTDSTIKSFGIEKLGDYIHVQKQVLNTLVAENFFTDNENRRRVDINKASGMVIETNKSGIDETFNLKNFARIGKNKKVTKLATIRRLPEIIENGTIVDDNVPNQYGDNNNKKFAYIEHTFDVDGQDVTIRIDIKKSPQKNKFWVHRVWEKENVSNFPASTNEGAEAGHTKADINKTISHPERFVNEFHSEKEQSVYDIMGETERVIGENAKLNADVNKLNDIIGTGEVANKRFLSLSNYLKKLSGSNIDSAILGNKLKEAYTSMQESDSLNWNDIARKTYGIAESIMSNDLDVPVDYFQRVMHEIRKDKISLSEEQRARMEERFGGYGNFHKYVFGRANITKDGTPLSDAWKNWAKIYPSLFDANLQGAEQIDALVELVTTLKTTNTLLSEYEHSEAIRHLSTEIYNQFWNIAADSSTSENAKAYRAEHKAMMEGIRKDYEQRQKDLVAHPVGETALKYENLLKKVQDRKRKEIAQAKEHGREMLSKYKDNAERKTKIQRITANALTLNKWLTKNNKDYHIHEAMKGPVIKLLNALDFSSKRKIENGDPTQRDISLAEAFSDVKSMLQDADNMVEGLESLYGHDLAESISLLSEGAFRLVGDNNYVINAMTNEQLFHLDKLVSHIKKVVTELNKFHTIQHNQGAVHLANEFMEHGEKLGNIKKQHGIAGKFFEFKNRTPYYFFKDLGKVGEKLFEAFQDGWDKLAFNAKRVIDFTNETYTEKEVKKWSKETKEFKLSQFDGSERTFNMTIAQIMALHCVSKQEDAQTHLLSGGMTLKRIDKKGHVVADYENITLTLSDIQSILATLTDRQREVANELQKFMNTVCSDWGNEISMARFGIEMFGIPDYFPIKVSEATVPTDNTKDVDNASLFRLLNMSFTKSRNKNANQSIEIGDIFDIFAQHASDMAKYNALALPVLDFNKFYSIHSKDITGKEYGVVKTLKSVFGDEANGYLRRFVRDLNGSQNVSRDVIGKTFFKNAKLASVAANLRVVLLQPTAFYKASAVLDNKYLLKASAYMNFEPVGMYKRYKNAVDKAEKYCGIVQWKSLGYYDTDISKGLTEKIKHAETFGDKVTEKSMKGAEVADKATFGTLWVACEFEIRDKRKDLKIGSEEFYNAVAKRLRDVIYATQVVDSTMTRSDMMRSPDGNDKFLTTFGSEPIIAYNMLLDMATQYKRDKQEFGKKEAKKRNGKKIRKVITAYVITNAVAALVESAFDVFRDDEEETDIEEFVKLYLKNFALDMSIGNKLPFIKEVYSAMQGYSSSRMDTQWLQYLQYAFNSKKPETILKNLLKAFSQVSGYAFYNLYRDTMAFLDMLDIFSAEDINEMFDGFLD